jgi:hypothetical protein
MPDHLNTDAAIKQAEAAFIAWLKTVQTQVDAHAAGGKWTVPIKNDGTDDYIWLEKQDDIMDKWKNKAALKGFDRRSSPTSMNEGKIDLKFAYPGQAKSSFNYHIWVKKNPAVIEAQRLIEQKAAQAKKLAAENKARIEQEKKDKAAADKKADELKKKALELQKKMDQDASTAWNKFKTTKAWNNKIVEKTWKAQWVKDNAKKYK